MEPIAVVGVGQTAFSGERRESTHAELVHEAVLAALADAGLSIKDIDNIVTCSNDFWDGRTISSMAIGDAAGAAYGEGKNISTVEGDGTSAAFYGASRILSGSYKTTLVVAHSKGSEGDSSLITNAFCDPVSERAIGLDATSAAALQARVYLDAERLGPEDCAQVVVKNRRHGAKNPQAHLREAISLETVLGSPELAPPLRQNDVCPISDGAAAVILASADAAPRAKTKPVWLRGVGLCADAPMTQRPLNESSALRKAAASAYSMAGVSDPAREIDLAEISEQYSYQELLWLKELRYPRTDRVNLSGGCLSAHAWNAAGLVRMIEAALQLRGQAANQGPGGRLALAHGQYGLCGQSQTVWVLGL